jgi:putative endonuclease
MGCKWMASKSGKKGSYFVYLVRCRYGTYYAGYTNDLENRIQMHNEGRGAKYLRGKAPIELVYCREYRYLKDVLRAERNLKELTRSQKEKLVIAYDERARRG